MDSVLDRSLGHGFDALEALLDKTEDRQQTERDVRIMMMSRQLLMAIDAERERRGLTKNDLAGLAGINPQQVRRMFTSEKANPTLKTLLAVLAALRIEWSFESPETQAQTDGVSTDAMAEANQAAAGDNANTRASNGRHGKDNGRKRDAE